MKKRLIMFSLITLLSFSCSNPTVKGFKEYYDYSWIQGDNALTSEMPSIKNPKGDTNVLNSIRRSQNKMGLPTKGEANLLVVPINFEGDIGYQLINKNVDITFSTNDLKDIKNVFFGNENDYPSVKTFYEASSFNNLKLDGVVTPIVTLPKEYTSYLTKAHVSSASLSISEIIEYVYDYLFEVTKTYYVGDFDADNDGRVDAINIVCNYPSDISYGDTAIDATHLSLISHENVYFTSDLLDKEKTKVNSYSMLSDSYRSSFKSKLFINQIGRMLGLDDYEDKIGNTLTNYYRAPLSYFDMMSGFCLDHNSFSKYQLGWINPRFINYQDIENEMTITLKSSITSGEAIILYSNNKSLFGEYLMIDLYTLDGVNAYDSNNYSPYGVKAFDKEGVRVYQVDSTLVRGYKDNYLPYLSTPSFEETKTLPNGENVSYIYDYAYTNSYVSKYDLGTYPLVTMLSKNGVNRHMTNSNVLLSSSDLFLEGDSFGNDSQIDGFYKDFKFHNGDSLNITFTIDKIENGIATITLRRA